MRRRGGGGGRGGAAKSRLEVRGLVECVPLLLLLLLFLLLSTATGPLRSHWPQQTLHEVGH
eukprot:2824581-Pyramimonas_sp.AAC.1